MPCAYKFLVKAKALSIYKNLSKDDDDVKPLNVSTDWVCKFTKRYNLHNIKMTGEAAAAEIVAAEKFFIAFT